MKKSLLYIASMLLFVAACNTEAEDPTVKGLDVKVAELDDVSIVGDSPLHLYGSGFKDGDAVVFESSDQTYRFQSYVSELTADGAYVPMPANFVYELEYKVIIVRGTARIPLGTIKISHLTGYELDYSLLTAENHPRIIFTDDDFNGLKQALNTNPVLKTLHNIIIKYATPYVGYTDLERTLTGKRLLSVCRIAELRILFCAYSYKTTGDTKFLTQAEHDIRTACNFTDWNAKQHFLDVGEMAAGVAIGYDWLYNDLSEDTRKLVESALYNFAFYPAQNKIWNKNFYNAKDNWNQVCNGGLVCAALAVYESNQNVAREIIEKAIETNVNAMSMYAPDGNYPEGYSYWNYGTIYEALMLTAMETAAGKDGGLSLSEGFSTTGKYMLHMECPNNKVFNYSDCSVGTTPCLAQWYFAYKFGDTSNLYREKFRIDDNYATQSEGRLLPFIMYFVYKLNLTGLDDIPAPTEQMYHGDGTTPVVLIHDNWALDETDQFLGIKGGYANGHHAHQDAGSFVYDAENVRWAADLGMQSYTTLEPYIDLWDYSDGSERWLAFRLNNFNHNTLTVNNAYHKVDGSAEFTDVINDGSKKGAVVNLTTPLSTEVASAVRTVYLENGDLYIKDEITALSTKEAKVRWTMVSEATPTVEADDIVLTSTTGKYRYLTATSSTGHVPVLTTWSTKGVQAYDADNTGYYECGYEVTVKAGEKAEITIKLASAK